MTTTPTAERLLELLEIRDAELEQARNSAEDLRRQIKWGIDWMYQERGAGLGGDLPVPRLELTLLGNDGYGQEYEVVLVVAHRDSQVSRVPLAHSKNSGATLDLEALPTTGELPVDQHHVLPGLFSDLLCFQKKMPLPAYIVYTEQLRYAVTPQLDGKWPVDIMFVDGAHLAATGKA